MNEIITLYYGIGAVLGFYLDYKGRFNKKLCWKHSLKLHYIILFIITYPISLFTMIEKGLIDNDEVISEFKNKVIENGSLI